MAQFGHVAERFYFVFQKSIMQLIVRSQATHVLDVSPDANVEVR